MRLIQCDYHGQVRAALVENEQQVRLLDCDTYTLANRAISAGQSLNDSVTAALTDTRLDYQALVDDKHLLPPLTHPDPAHCLVTGTGLTHLGSADTRSAMHAKAQANPVASIRTRRRRGTRTGRPLRDWRGRSTLESRVRTR